MLRNNLSYAFRSLTAKPGFTLAAVFALALGIGANTAIFSIVNASLIQPLPFRDVERLVAVWQSLAQGSRVNFSPREVQMWQHDLGVFEQIGGSTGNGFVLTGRGDPEPLLGQLATPSLFDTFGARAVLGRTFLPEEGEAGHEHVVLLSYAWWKERFGGEESILGQLLDLSGEPYTVVGVMPKEFDYPRSAYKFWIPAALNGKFFAKYPDAHLFRMVGKLKPGITPERLNADLAVLGPRISQADALRKVVAAPLREDLVGPVRAPLLLLLCAGCVVLLIACANVANLLLTRATGRRKEIAIRAAMGASRADIIRQLLTESTLLSLFGGAAGLALAVWALDAFKRLGPKGTPWLQKAHLDPTVLFFTAAVAIVTGMLFGLAPALTGSRADLNHVLQQSPRGTASGGSAALRHSLVFCETALCVVLLIAAGLLFSSLLSLERVNPGFSPCGVITAGVAVQQNRYPDSAGMLRFYRAVLGEVAAQPGFEAAGVTTHLPFSGQGWGNGFEIEGRPAPPGHGFSAQVRAISPGYFRSMGIPLLAGRDVTERDSEKAPGVVLINQTLARRYWPAGDPVGKRIRIDADWLTVSGVVGDLHHLRLDLQPDPEIYLPYPQLSSALMNLVGRGLSLVVRTPLDTAAASTELRKAIHSADREMAVWDIAPMETLIADSVAQPRFRTSVIGLFAALAVVLACVGIYSVISYAVAQRVQEIGIRMALGARPGNVVGMVLGRTLMLVAPAAVAGVVGALAASQLLAGLLFGVKPNDPATYVIYPLALILVALAAAYIPARRAASLDPMSALRDG
jgi:putative ABC transport system permease protein